MNYKLLELRVNCLHSEYKFVSYKCFLLQEALVDSFIAYFPRVSMVENPHSRAAIPSCTMQGGYKQWALRIRTGTFTNQNSMFQNVVCSH